MTPLAVALIASLAGGCLTIVAAALGARWQAAGAQTEDTRQRDLNTGQSERNAILARLSAVEATVGKADSRLSSIETALLYLLPAYRRIMASQAAERGDGD